MAIWLNKIAIKDLLTTSSDEEASERAPVAAILIAGRIRALIKVLENRESEDDISLASDLDEIADIFENFPALKGEDEDLLETFNGALAELYDIGDRGHRLWVG
jgi:hypothetical protein